MTTTFQRQANTILKDAGYAYVGVSGKAHEIWRKDGVPDIHVPGSPSGGRDSMLARVRRAIRKGTALTPPSGQETDVAAPAGKKDAPMSERLIEHASSYLKKKVEQRKALAPGTKMPPDKKYPGEIAKWVRRCVETHGAISNADLAEAAKVLMLDPAQLSHGRQDAGCVSYRTSDMPAHQFVTDFVGRVPAGAKVSGGATKAPPKLMAAAEKEAAKEERMANRKPPLRIKATGRNGDVEIKRFEPTVASNGALGMRIENPGRPLEQGGLTPEERDEAEQRMLAGHRKAEDERAALLAERGADMQVVTGETNGKKALSGLEAAVELLVQEALAATFSLTDEDIRTLQGIQETQRRHAEESTACAGQIGLMLKRVAAKKAEVAAVA